MLCENNVCENCDVDIISDIETLLHEYIMYMCDIIYVLVKEVMMFIFLFKINSVYIHMIHENQLNFFILFLFLLIFTTIIRHNLGEKNTCLNTQGMPRFAYFEGTFSKFSGGVPPNPPKRLRRFAPSRNASLHSACNFQLFFLWGLGNTEQGKQS